MAKTTQNLFREGVFNPFKEMTHPLFDMETLTLTYQRNAELMNETQKIATEAVQTMMELQNQYLKAIFDQWSKDVKKSLSQSALEEKTDHQSESKKAMIDKTIEHARDINAVIEKSNKQLVDSIQKHFKEGLDESVQFAEKMKKKH